MENSESFGRLVRQQRGQQSQSAIAKRGGPYRQLQARIERGDQLRLTDGILEQYDKAFQWSPGTCATILRGAQEPAAAAAANDAGGALGHDATTGLPIEIPRLLRTTLPAHAFNTVISSWPGVAVFDTQILDQPERSAAYRSRSAIPSWIQQGETGSQTQRLVSDWTAAAPRRTVMSVGVHNNYSQRVAIDPVPGITNTDQARELVHAVNTIHVTLSPVDEVQVPFTLLFAAAQARHPAYARRALLAIEAVELSQEDPAYQAPCPTWDELYPPGLLSFGEPNHFAAQLFSGLHMARDHSCHTYLDRSTTPARPIREWPTIVPASEVEAGTLLLHDAAISPELPAVISWATMVPTLALTRSTAATPVAGHARVIEFLPPEAQDHAPTRPAPGEALLTHMPNTPHPLLMYGADSDSHPVSVVLPKRLESA